MSLLLLFNQAGGGGSTTTTLEPTKGAIRVIGYAPGVQRSASVTPTCGHLVFSGKQPAVTQSKDQSVSPVGGHITFVGNQPTISRTAHQTVAPVHVHLSTLGHQPTLSQTVSATVSPAAGHIALDGRSPAIRQDITVTPSAGHVSLGGSAPEIQQDTAVAPAGAHILLLGKSPTVLQTANQIVLPFTGRVSLRCHAPKVERTVKITSDDLTMLTEIWARMELDATRPVTVSPTTLEFDGVVQTHSAEGASRHGPTLPANEAPGQMILEVWQRLGLDPENPLVQTPVAISAGAINLTLSEAAGSITVTRNA